MKRSIMEIDQNAPMTARTETFVAAPPETVWAVQTDVERWPEWQADVSSVELEGELAVGTTVTWKARGAGITSTIEELEPGQRIGWTGRSLGMRAIHVWSFEPQDEGTQVVTEESLSGWLPTLLRFFAPTFLEKSLAGSLQDLKDEAERKSTP